MELLKIVRSKNDNTTKLIFRLECGSLGEFSHINKNDGKDIICVPCQTMCNVGCKFCHTSDYINRLPLRSLTFIEIIEGVKTVIEELGLTNRDHRGNPNLCDNPDGPCACGAWHKPGDGTYRSLNKTLLVSFMGCGEPLRKTAYNQVVNSMVGIQWAFTDRYVRFAIATCIPKKDWQNFFELTNLIKDNQLPVKLHLSLHYTNDKLRKEWMPQSSNIVSSLVALSHFNETTGNPIEIHYALISGVNDSQTDIMKLTDLISDHAPKANVKFLFYNRKDSLEAAPSDISTFEKFKVVLAGAGISSEYYLPPGLDIGASCGQFLMDQYVDCLGPDFKI